MHPREKICIRAGEYASARENMHPREKRCIRAGEYASAREHAGGPNLHGLCWISRKTRLFSVIR